MPVAYRVVRPFTSDGVIQRPGKIVTGRGWRLIKPLVRQRFLEQIPVTDDEFKKLVAETPAPPPAPVRAEPANVVEPPPASPGPPPDKLKAAILRRDDVESPDTSDLVVTRDITEGDEGNGEGKRSKRR